MPCGTALLAPSKGLQLADEKFPGGKLPFIEFPQSPSPLPQVFTVGSTTKDPLWQAVNSIGPIKLSRPSAGYQERKLCDDACQV